MTALPITLNPAWKEPGDFLYYHPYSTEYAEATDYEGDGQHVRYMVEYVCDDEHDRWVWIQTMFTTCPKCHVGWQKADDGPLCWVCGGPGVDRMGQRA